MPAGVCQDRWAVAQRTGDGATRIQCSCCLLPPASASWLIEQGRAGSRRRPRRLWPRPALPRRRAGPGGGAAGGGGARAAAAGRPLCRPPHAALRCLPRRVPVLLLLPAAAACCCCLLLLPAAAATAAAASSWLLSGRLFLGVIGCVLWHGHGLVVLLQLKVCMQGACHMAASAARPGAGRCA